MTTETGDGGGGPGAGDGGGDPPFEIRDGWKSALPEDVRDAPAMGVIPDDVKGFTTFARNYVSAQSHVGADPDSILKLPADMDAAGAMDAIYDRLGRPAAADKYELVPPEGQAVDQALEVWARGAFHEIGLTQTQAKGLYDKWNAMSAERATALANDAALKAGKEDAALKAEWGDAYDAKLAAGQKAAARFGFDAAALDALQGQVGYAAVMKGFATMGAALGEDADVPPGESKLGLTPDAAKAELAAMEADPEKMKALDDKLHPSHRSLTERRTELFRIIHGAAPVPR